MSTRVTSHDVPRAHVKPLRVPFDQTTTVTVEAEVVMMTGTGTSDLLVVSPLKPIGRNEQQDPECLSDLLHQTMTVVSPVTMTGVEVVTSEVTTVAVMTTAAVAVVVVTTGEVAVRVADTETNAATTPGRGTKRSRRDGLKVQP